MYLYRAAQPQRILPGPVLPGCAASLLSGMLTTLNLGAVQGLDSTNTQASPARPLPVRQGVLK